MERAGWIAEARCAEVRIAMEPDERLAYVQARPAGAGALGGRERGQAGCRAATRQETRRRTDPAYWSVPGQLHQIATLLSAPLITGETANPERNVLYDRFRSGEVKVLVVSRVANMAVDLPDASVAIQVSGLYGSRQEEAQRLGRLLRPKANGAQAQFYTLVTQDTVEQDMPRWRATFWSSKATHTISSHISER